MRPVVGALGASGLMLLACSWFVFNPGGVDAGRISDTPNAVRIDDGFNETVGEAHALRGSAGTTATQHVGSRPAQSRHASAKATTAPTPAVDGPRPTDASPATAPTTEEAGAPAPTHPAAPSAPATSPPDDQGGVTVTTPTLPPPLDGVPTITTPTVPLPQVPSVPVPDLPTTPPKLGLP